MILEGVDASYDKPTPAELVTAGKRFFVGYVSTPGHAKNLTPAYARGLQAAGLAVVVVGEISAGRALGGYALGAADMRSFVAQVRDLGGPTDGGVIYQAVDFDVVGVTGRPATRVGRELAAMLADLPGDHGARWGDPEALAALGELGRRITVAHAQVVAGQMGTVLDFLRGGASVRGSARWTGPYGERDVCAAAANAGFGYLWNTYAWSGGLWEPRAQLQQYRNGQRLGSGTVDLDRAITADYGQWQRQQEDALMALTDAQQQELLAAARQINGAVGAGQAGFSTTIEATLGTVQALVNLVKGAKGELVAGIADTRSAVLGAVAALPPPETPEQAAAARDQILEVLAHLGVEGVPPDALLDALHARLAA